MSEPYRFKRVKDILFALTRPTHWLRNEPASADWDRVLNRLLDEYEIERCTDYTVSIGGVRVWVANYPYAYGTLRGDRLRRETKLLPYRRTARRLRRLEPQADSGSEEAIRALEKAVLPAEQ